MDQRMTRFKHCDLRFFPYLEKVLDRLPGRIREDILNSTALQVVAGEDCSGQVKPDTLLSNI